MLPAQVLPGDNMEMEVDLEPGTGLQRHLRADGVWLVPQGS